MRGEVVGGLGWRSVVGVEVGGSCGQAKNMA